MKRFVITLSNFKGDTVQYEVIGPNFAHAYNHAINRWVLNGYGQFYFVSCIEKGEDE